MTKKHRATPSKIIGIQFSILSADEIRRNSVVEVTSRDTYINNKPVIGGMFDPRMGVLEPGTICPTDGFTYIDTPGYFGHIELARPVFFMQHLKEIVKISKCVCFKCSKLLISKPQHLHALLMTNEDRWEYVSKLATKVKRCGEQTEDGCGCKQPDKIKVEEMASVNAIWDNIETESGKSEAVIMRLTPELILKNFKRISDEDVNFMGFSPVWSRPDSMICQVLPVPPPAVRPSVKHDAQQRSEDDLTHIYSNIIKTNSDLKEKMANGASANVIDGLARLLQYFVAMIVNNKTKGAAPLAQRSGRPYQCISSRVNTKNGRIRGNLMGKRVDYSARSVISGDPNLSIRELGVPMKVAMNITKPVTVNDRNRDFLRKLVQNGPETYPGAKILERKNGESISLRYVDRNSIILENDDVVHRHMMDGDAVLFNRQPSLHRMSMMCHIAKIMKRGDTFRMNVGDTKPYNADFDGDEMNMHMPQNVLAETELRHLAAIPYQIVSPASNAPIIGIYQDSLLGSFRFTRPNVKFTPRDAMNLLMMYSKVDTKALRNAGGKVSSFDILSQIMAPITLNYKTNMFGDGEDYGSSNNVLEIRNGKYIRGQIEKSVLASTTKGVLHRIFNDYGNMACSNFIDDLQNVVTEYMKSSSYSVGVSDLIADKTTQQKILQAILKQKLEVQSLIDKVHLGIFQNNTASSDSVEFEMQVNNILNKARDDSGKIARESLNANNRFLMIVKSGSKGNMLNISQMISGLGQQNVDGKRIPYGFDNRTLPHYNKFDDSPSARGFVENSYISGLTAQELFFHAMGGRIGLIDTAVKTSQTGYIQRRLIKGLEDLKVEYDMTVRNNKGRIVQFAYGDDGIDTTRVENQSIPLAGMSIEDICMHYDITENISADIYTKSTATRIKKQEVQAKEMCEKYITKMIASRKMLVESVFKNKNEDGVKMPVSFANTISNIQGQLSLNSNSIVDITPLEAFQLIEEYFTKLQRIEMVKPGKLFELLYYYYLSPKNLLVIKRFHRSALILLLETIILKYKQSIVHPGEMVGVIAGQSIGEPTTQMTLNTFHLAGVASKSNVTRGVPRIEELLRLTSNPKNPSLTIHLKPIDETDKDKAIKYANMIEYMKLSDLVKSMQICFDPNERSTFIESDRLLLEQFYEFEDIMDECNGKTVETRQQSKWIIRMEMNAETMLEKNITMDDIHFAIKNSSYGENVNCVFSDYNRDKLIFRIRVFDVSKKKKIVANTLDQSDEIYALKNMQDVILTSIVLRGVNNIDKVTPRKLQNMVSYEDGKYARKDVWVLDTTGSNLLKVLGLDYVDSFRTYSNDIREICDVLGIEAARQVLFNEITEVMEFSDAYINYHHLSLLCDRMAISKNMVPIFRSGILNDDIGPIAKATFEVHTEVLLNAARHADFDHMRGVSASVMCGQYGKYGTGAFNVILDMKEMAKLSAATINQTSDIEKMFEMNEERADVCSTNTIKIRNNVSNIKQTRVDDCDDDYNMGL
jgi:DNA-directed RNA polymerase II subunit RPB1